MSQYGLLIDYNWCSGCHSCEMACAVEHNYPIGQCGIVINEIGPWKIADDNWQLSYSPAFTKQCDLCAQRTAVGKAPTCVSHCQSKCMSYGTVEELFQKARDKSTQMLIIR